MTSDSMLPFSAVVLLCSIQPLTSMSYQETNSPLNMNSQPDTSTDELNPKCYGSHQSPINIVRQSVTSNKKVLVNLVNYNTTIITVENMSKAHQSVSFKMGHQASQSLIISRFIGNRTTETEYHLYNFHFHWNCTEHLFDNQRYALELHFVHYNRQLGNFQQAALVKGGLAVLAVLFELSNRDNEALGSLFDHLGSNQKPLYYSDFLPKTYFTVYHYNGSLTTEPCHESVYWNVASELNYISPRQILRFQRLHVPPIPMNCRPSQPINDRSIYNVKITATTTNKISTDGTCVSSPRLMLYIVTILIVIIHESKSV